MKTLLKLLIPTLVPYFIFARYTKLDDSHRHITEQLTEISLTSLMYYFRYVGYIIYPIFFLTQYVVVLPIWKRVNGGPLRAAAFTLLWMIAASLVLAIGVSYVIWDTSLGDDSLYRSIKALFGVQAVYWLVNLLILFIIELIIHKRASKNDDKEEK